MRKYCTGDVRMAVETSGVSETQKPASTKMLIAKLLIPDRLQNFYAPIHEAVDFNRIPDVRLSRLANL